MLSFDRSALPLALSTLIQVVKSKTLGPNLDGHGFVPGYSKGKRWLSEDRTERPMGSQIVLQIYQRWNQTDVLPSDVKSSAPSSPMKWLLELLYHDLLDWNNWLWEKRIGPLNMAVLGSDPCLNPMNKSTQWCKPSWGMAHLQGARFESLDNSPMYDAPDPTYSLWNQSTYRMRLYDVGQSAAIVAECESLAAIADILGQTADAALLRQRQTNLGDLIRNQMWEPNLSVFTNLLDNGTHYPRISPTSFYPMISGIATDEQATSMVTAWLTNVSRFCVPTSPSAWPPVSVPKDPKGCYWGVPSISADDPQFLVPGGTSGIYWRGETWAPQVYLVYVALSRYDHIPVIREARKGLCAQQLDLVLSVWDVSHNICENYPSTFINGSEVTGNQCTGNHFYDWGGLSGFISLIEAGYY